jgi:hypothetical protein
VARTEWEVWVGRSALKFQAPVTEGREAGSATEKLRTGTVTKKLRAQESAAESQE